MAAARTPIAQTRLDATTQPPLVINSNHASSSPNGRRITSIGVEDFNVNFNGRAGKERSDDGGGEEVLDVAAPLAQPPVLAQRPSPLPPHTAKGGAVEAGGHGGAVVRRGGALPRLAGPIDGGEDARVAQLKEG